jgi:hypothetical protein
MYLFGVLFCGIWVLSVAFFCCLSSGSHPNGLFPSNIFYFLIDYLMYLRFFYFRRWTVSANKRVVFSFWRSLLFKFFWWRSAFLFVGGEHFPLFLCICITFYLYLFFLSACFHLIIILLAVSQEIGIQYIFFVIFFASGILVMCQ